MLSFGSLGCGSDRYYTALAKEDYYFEGGEPPGTWWGRGVAAFGLEQGGKVDAGDLHNFVPWLRSLRGTTGEERGQREAKPGLGSVLLRPKERVRSLGRSRMTVSGKGLNGLSSLPHALCAVCH